jgi:hypothetical protein
MELDFEKFRKSKGDFKRSIKRIFNFQNFENFGGFNCEASFFKF